MKLVIAGNIQNIKDLIFAFKYENMIRDISIFLPKGQENNKSIFSSFHCIESEELLEHFFKNESPFFIIADYSPSKKENLYNRFQKLGGIPFSYFSGNSLISRDNKISNKGVIIQMQCNVSADVELSEGVELGVQTLIGHDVKIGAFTSIGSKCSILGYVEIGKSCQIGHGVTIMPGVKIEDNTIIDSNQTIKKK